MSSSKYYDHLSKEDAAIKLANRKAEEELAKPPASNPLTQEDLDLLFPPTEAELEERKRKAEEALSQPPMKELSYDEKVFNLSEALGGKIPFHPNFEEHFVSIAKQWTLTTVVAQLSRWAGSWLYLYPDFFSIEEGGYQYLIDILVEARYAGKLPDSPTINRAIEWLEYSIEHEPLNARIETEPEVSRVLPTSFYDLLSGGYTAERLDKLIGSTGLKLFDFEKKVATAHQKASDWVTVYWALRNKGYIPKIAATLAVDIIKRTFPSTRISATRINDDNPGEKPSKDNTYYHRVISLL